MTADKKREVQIEINSIDFIELLNKELIKLDLEKLYKSIELLQTSYDQVNKAQPYYTHFTGYENEIRLEEISQKVLISRHKLPSRILTNIERQLIRNCDNDREYKKTRYVKYQETKKRRLEVENQEEGYELINPYEQLTYLRQDLTQTLNSDNIESLINLSTFHEELLNKQQIRISLMVDSHISNSKRLLLYAALLFLICFYVPMVGSVAYLLRYMKKLIDLFSNVQYIDDQDLKSEINNLEGLNCDLNNLGDVFENNNMSAIKKSNSGLNKLRQLVEEENENQDDYSIEQKDNYEQKPERSLNKMDRYDQKGNKRYDIMVSKYILILKLFLIFFKIMKRYLQTR